MYLVAGRAVPSMLSRILEEGPVLVRPHVQHLRRQRPCHPPAARHIMRFASVTKAHAKVLENLMYSATAKASLIMSCPIPFELFPMQTMSPWSALGTAQRV